MSRLVAVAFILAAIASPALAMRYCGPLESIERNVIVRAGQVPVAIGLLKENMVKLFVNQTTGSWTLLLITANRVACIEAVGQDMEFVPPKPHEEPS